MAGAVPIGRRCTQTSRPSRGSRNLTTCAALIVALAAGAARARDPREIERLSDAEVERRYAFIQERLEARRLHAELWHWGWTAINGGALVGLSVAGGLADTDADRVSFFSQAALAGVGVIDVQLMRRLPALDGYNALRKMPAATPAERRARLLEAEGVLERAARRPGEWDDWWPHLGNLLANAAVGIGIWQAGSRTDGLISGLSGAVVGELYILSQPGSYDEDLAAYRRFTGSSADSGGRWSLIATTGGLGLRYEF